MKPRTRARSNGRANGATRPSRLASLRDTATLREFVRNLQEGVYITTPSGEILDANPALLEIFGVDSLEELRGSRINDLLVDSAARAREMDILLREGRVRDFELQVRRADGEVRTVLDTTYVCRDAKTGEVFCHGVLIDISARKRLSDRLVELSLRDPLTGCYNRRYLGELERRVGTRTAEHWGCIILDIDHFKQFNDRFGHQAGDRVLVKMSRFLMRHVRAEDAVVRLGGDEFVVLLAESDSTRTEQVVERLRRSALRAAPAEFSLGWSARYPRESLSKMLGRADRNLLAVRVETRGQRRERD